MSRKYWFSYTGGNVTSASNYTLLTPGPIGCVDGPEICAIYALYGGDTHPLSISPNINSYIGRLFTSHVSEPRGNTLFVYANPSI